MGNTTSKFYNKGLINVALCDGPAGLRLARESGLKKDGSTKPYSMPLSFSGVFSQDFQETDDSRSQKKPSRFISTRPPSPWQQRWLRAGTMYYWNKSARQSARENGRVRCNLLAGSGFEHSAQPAVRPQFRILFRGSASER